MKEHEVQFLVSQFRSAIVYAMEHPEEGIPKVIMKMQEVAVISPVVLENTMKMDVFYNTVLSLWKDHIFLSEFMRTLYAAVLREESSESKYAFGLFLGATIKLLEGQ